IDGNGEPRHYGAEATDYYSRLPKPYEPGNRYLRSIDELLMVKGYTTEVFKAIAPFVTGYSPDGLVNINTAPQEVLMSLSDDVNSDLAARIMEFRKETPFKDRSGIMKVPGFETIGFALQDRITAQSSVYRIFSRAVAGEAVREVEAVVRVGGGVLYWRES
ncbi:MAG: type II secretion system protein GspK, partial [Deltaproteobacteria bacterium]|nr:type II secretion system protein GspK [Deltaproteobacteria bacterium]